MKRSYDVELLQREKEEGEMIIARRYEMKMF
jgi:hypothetical protein